MVGNRGDRKYLRPTKSLLETRPIWHKRDETIRGHVFCSFLAAAGVALAATVQQLEAW